MIIDKKANSGKLYIFLTEDDLSIHSPTHKKHIASFWPSSGRGQLSRLNLKLRKSEARSNLKAKELAELAIISTIVNSIFQDSLTKDFMKAAFKIDAYKVNLNPDQEIEAIKSVIRIQSLLNLSI